MPKQPDCDDAAAGDESVEQGKLSFVEKTGYGLGDAASNLYWKLFENFQLYFYTDVFGISAAAAGTMFLLTKLWDAVNDLVVGYLADRTRTAWGRFRPYLLWGAVPFAVTGILTFYTPDFSPTGKLVYAYITYTAVFMAYTMVNTPYGALMGVITPDPNERTSVTTFRFLLAFTGGLFVQMYTLKLVGFFGGTEKKVIDGVAQLVVVNPQAGFFWTVVCYAIVAALLFVVTFLTTKERVEPVAKSTHHFREDILDLLRNRGWIVLQTVGLLQFIAMWTRGSAIAYYFTYYVGVEFGNFLAVGTVSGIIGLLFTPALTRAFGKRRLMIMCHLGVGSLVTGFYFLKPDQIYLMYGLHAASAFVGAPMAIVTWAMCADTADHSEWVNHRRATGLFFSAMSFSHKLGGSLGAALPGWMLGYCQFQPPIDGIQQAQTEASVDGIIAMNSLIPAVFFALAAATFCFYDIDEDKLKTIEHDLKQRRLETHD